MRRLFLGIALASLAAQLAAPDLPSRDVRTFVTPDAPARRPSAVHGDIDGTLLAPGERYQASFGAEGFPCVPFFDLSQPLSLEVTLGARVLAIPSSPSLVGNTCCVQGFAVGPGTCLGNLRFSDPIDFTLRRPMS